MIDHPFQLIKQAINESINLKSLWVVDENISEAQIRQVQARDNLYALTNRYDIFQSLHQQGIQTELNDFNFSVFPESYFDGVFYRVSKEKPIVHHVINSLPDVCAMGAHFYLAGYKNDGVVTYGKKATVFLGDLVAKERSSKTAQLFVINVLQENPQAKPLDSKNYTDSIIVEDIVFNFFSKPGIYGWNKIDKGSQLLVDTAEDYFSNHAVNNARLLDIGCGYGYLSVNINRIFPFHQTTATDNNVAAVSLCQENLKRANIPAEVMLSDAGNVIADTVDCVICNPPFHQGFDVESDLTEVFIKSAKRLLNKEGVCLFVVNSFIPIEKKARHFFSKVELLSNNGSFKVVALSH